MGGLPFFVTWRKQKLFSPRSFVSGRGSWLKDDQGARWLDLASLSYQANLGHGHKGIVAAIQKQARQLPAAMPNWDFPAKRELAQRLLKLAPPGFDRVFFALGGAEAVENAYKIARLVTNRDKVVTRYRSYHGATMGALSLTGDYRRPPLEPGLPGVVRAHDCYCFRCPFGQQPENCNLECANAIGEQMALEGKGSIAAVLVETVPGANGVLVPKAGYLKKLAQQAKAHGALLILDEVLTGFGRTGKMFAFEHFDVRPDIIVVAKGLTSGYAPLGAVLVHSRISKHFDTNMLYAGLTNYGHPLGCAAALATLETFRSERVLTSARRVGRVLERWSKRMASLPSVADARGLGALWALELNMSNSDLLSLQAMLAKHRLLVHLYPDRRTLILSPPLIIDSDDLRGGLAKIEACVKELASD